MVGVVLDNVALEALFVLGVVLDEAAVELGLHHGKRVVVHRVDCGSALATVNHSNLTEVLSFEQLLHLDLFATIVTYGDLAVAFANVVERLFLKIVTLGEYRSVRQLQISVEALYNGRQETVHTLAHLSSKVDHFLSSGG